MECRLRNAGVSNCSFDTDDGVVVRSMTLSRFLSGVMNVLSICRLLEDMGVRPNLGVLSVSDALLRLVGVAAIAGLPTLNIFVGVPLFGVPSSLSTSRSNKPSTLPSRCGVGPRVVTGVGLKSLREIAGVFIRSSSGRDSFLGVSICRDLFFGVSTGWAVGARFWLRESCRVGGGILPERTSRTRL